MVTEDRRIVDIAEFNLMDGKQADFEERMVLSILQLSGHGRLPRELRRLNSEITGRDSLTLEVLQRHLTGIPIRLVAAAHDLAASKHSFFKEIQKRAEYKAFHRLFEEGEDDGHHHCGLIYWAFERWLIMHNLPAMAHVSDVAAAAQMVPPIRQKRQVKNANAKDDYVILVATTPDIPGEVTIVQSLSYLLHQLQVQWKLPDVERQR